MAGQGRRLSDKIIDAFDMACAQNELEVAEGLYRVLEIVLTHYGGAGKTDKRLNTEFILEAGARLEKAQAAQRAA
jgi:hypothetical protein